MVVKFELSEVEISTVIRKVLRASVGNAEPSSKVWAQIQRYIEKSASRLPIHQSRPSKP